MVRIMFKVGDKVVRVAKVFYFNKTIRHDYNIEKKPNYVIITKVIGDYTIIVKTPDNIDLGKWSSEYFKLHKTYKVVEIQGEKYV